MKNLSAELKTGLLAPLVIMLFALLMYTTSANADIVEDTAKCFPNCTINHVTDTTISDELKWLCAERGGKDC